MEQQGELDHDRLRTPSQYLSQAGGSRLIMYKQGFYDPVNEKFTEPKHPGISYSFTADGYFEEAYYRAVANRTSTLYPPYLPADEHPVGMGML